MERTSTRRPQPRRQNGFLSFMKSWGIFILLLAAIILSRVFLWGSARVDGNSMDPTLASNQKLIMTSVGSPQRFDIVVAKETTAQTQRNDAKATAGITVVKRVIGMPGDTVRYANDRLYINGKEEPEPYLKQYQRLFAENKLADYYGNYSLKLIPSSDSGATPSKQRALYVQLAKESKAFTTDSTGSTNFTIKVPAGHYLLLGDDRVISADSRKVGPFARSQIEGKVILRIWPLNKIGIL